MEKNYDFSGWATRANLQCSDGRVIMKNAFKHHDGQRVPLVWNHQHNDPENVLGHAILENRENGVYAYCAFNDTLAGQKGKLLVKHGDVTALSIYANQLKQHGANVIHGIIRELSLVLAGANPGAFIDNIISHGEESEDSAIIFTGESIELSHADKDAEPKQEKKETDMEQKNNEKTIQDIIDSMTEEQKTVMYALVGQALEDNSENNEKNNSQGDGTTMKHNVFENGEMNKTDVLSHAEQMEIINDAKRYGSLKDAVLEHGIEKIDYLFPDSKTVTPTPTIIDRDQSWVKRVMNSVHRTPFSRIKSVFANITEDEARAKGYIKGKKKKDEVFTLLKRTTDPTTVYKKQSMDRDDIVDITDFDVIAWLRNEMRGKLDEELARAFLIGDGRLGSSDDKINPLNIRPIWTDDDLYTVKALIPVTTTNRTKEFITTCIKQRKNYKGSGTPSLYTTEDILTDCLLLEDSTGRCIYDTVEKLTMKLRVKEIITVPVMENKTRNTDTGKTHELMGIIINLNDYNVGADKGGAINLFDDFDIDYNKLKYLIETRCSGALTVPYSAIVIEADVSITDEGDPTEEPNP